MQKDTLLSVLTAMRSNLIQQSLKITIVSTWSLFISDFRNPFNTSCKDEVYVLETNQQQLSQSD